MIVEVACWSALSLGGFHVPGGDGPEASLLVIQKTNAHFKLQSRRYKLLITVMSFLMELLGESSLHP